MMMKACEENELSLFPPIQTLNDEKQFLLMAIQHWQEVKVQRRRQREQKKSFQFSRNEEFPFHPTPSEVLFKGNLLQTPLRSHVPIFIMAGK
jgi:hypothetical protein